MASISCSDSANRFCRCSILINSSSRDSLSILYHLKDTPRALITFSLSENVPTSVFLGKGSRLISEGLNTICCSEASSGCLYKSMISRSKESSRYSWHNRLIFSIASIDLGDIPDTYSFKTILPSIGSPCISVLPMTLQIFCTHRPDVQTYKYFFFIGKITDYFSKRFRKLANQCRYRKY